MPKSPKQKTRLSKSILPIKYQLRIQPDIEALTFIGNEVIDISLNKSEKSITLHSKDLEITDGWWQVGKTKIDILKTSYNTKAETVSFLFAKKLPAGRGKLHLHFRGIIQDNLRGFYKSEYTHQGKTIRIVTTQFEATDARRAFPCFDEPSHKAVFEVSLVIPKHLTAISNTIETDSQIDRSTNGYKVVKFSPTPKMSTYLLAYIIGEFESIQTKTKSGVNIRVFTTKGKSYQAKFALDVAKRTLEFLNNYFRIPYPLPVLDLIAIPDFSAAAMENWGAVTFRESALLADEKHTAFANRQGIAYTIAHELVHQWFGNLVTMEWWTHLWLNESFATFMGYIAIDDLFPEWQIWTKFVMNDHAHALELDSLQNTHPIEVEVHHPDQISEIFDAISYEKGGSVLRMLMHYIGPDNFRDGLSYYLKKHSYKNTESVHLWEAFEKVSGKPVRKFMSTWVSKSGYPLVTVSETKIGELQITQQRFSLKDQRDQTLWSIPLQFELGKGKLSDLNLLTTKSRNYNVRKDSLYVKVNPQETGFYRTLYSPSLLAKLYEPIKRKELSVADRFGIIRDIFAMAKSGKLSTTVYLDFLQAYKDEDSYIVWVEILSGMAEIHNLIADSPIIKNQLEKYYLSILKKIAKDVGWEADHKETQTRALLRSAVLAKFGAYGDRTTQKKAQQLFAKRSTKAIDPDLRATVYFLTAMNGDKKTQKQMQAMTIKETLQEEQRRIARALMSFSNKQLFKQNLDFALSKHIRAQDAPILIFSAFQNSENREEAWNWLRKNWGTLHQRYHDDHLIVWVVKSLTGFTTEQKLIELNKFFKKHPVPAAQRAMKQVLEIVSLQAAWQKRDKTDITNCIKANLEL